MCMPYFIQMYDPYGCVYKTTKATVLRGKNSSLNSVNPVNPGTAQSTLNSFILACDQIFP